MEYVEKRIDLEQYPKGEVTILPIGDVQSGVPASDLTRLRRHMNWGTSNRALFLGMGDYVDMASPSNRRSLKAATLYDSVTSALEAKAQEGYRWIPRGSWGVGAHVARSTTGPPLHGVRGWQHLRHHDSSGTRCSVPGGLSYGAVGIQRHL